MILTPSYSSPKGVSSGVFSIPLRKYHPNVDKTIAVAKSHGYILPTDFELRMLNFLINELDYNKILQKYDLCYLSGYNSLRSFRWDSDISGGGSVGTDKLVFLDTIEQFTYLNLKDPYSFKLSRIAGVLRPVIPFYNYNGWSNVEGLDRGAYDTGYVPKDDGVNWTQNNAGVSVYVPENSWHTTNTNSNVVATRDTGVNRSAVSFITSNGTNFQGSINTNNTTTNTANTIIKGFFRQERTASNLTTVYLNGTSIGTNAQASSTMLGTTSIYLMGRNLDGTLATAHNGGLSFCAIGASLGSTLQKIEYEIFTECRSRLNYK